MAIATYPEARIIRGVAVLVVGALILTGCVAVERGVTEKVYLTAMPNGAIATVDDGGQVVTPAVVELRRGDNHKVVFHMDGYQDDTETLTPTTSYAMLGYSYLVGGPLSAAVDWGDGAARELSRDRLRVRLVALPRGTGATGPSTSLNPAASALPNAAQTVAATPAFDQDDPLSESAGTGRRLGHVLVEILVAVASGGLM